MTYQAWLRANLGKRCLAPLTSQDVRALDAAASVAALWSYTPKQGVADAFGAVVMLMQETTRHLAFHVVAQVGNWEDRATLWNAAGLPWPRYLTKCDNEPGGAAR